MTVKHILLDCTVFNVNRQPFYSEVCLTGLFKNVSPECILEFLSSVELKCPVHINMKIALMLAWG